MKIIKTILLSLLALSLVVCTGIFIFFQTFDTDQYLPQITQKVSFALGRSVSIGGVGLGFSSRGITLDAGPLTIADDSGFTTQPFIKVDRVRLSLDLSSLILRREIHITEIILQSPQIHFIRSQEGNLNVRTIGQAIRSSSVKPSISSPALLKIDNRGQGPVLFESKNEKNSKLSPIIMPVIKIRDASISFIDQNQSNPLDIWLLNINANLNDFSLSKPFQLSFDASPLLIKGISAGMPDSPVFKDITGVVQLNMPYLDMGASGAFAGNGDIAITGGVVKNFNIIKIVLSHTLGGFGGMEVDIDNLLSGQLRSKLGASDTVIKKAEANFSFHDKTLFIDNFLIETNIFELTAQGSVDQGFNMDMQTMLHLNEDVSAALVNEIEGLKSLCDDSKRIAIGASLKGVIPHLKYKPNKDFRKKSKKVLMEEGGNILGVLLGGRRIQ